MRDLKEFIKNEIEYKMFVKKLKQDKKLMKINTLKNEIEALSNILCKKELTIKQLKGKLKKAHREIKELKTELNERKN